MMPLPSQQSKQFGFTIIELLVVIAIIGILAGIGIPNIMRSREVARLREVQNQVVADIARAKFFARRYSFSYTLNFNSTTKQYSFVPPSAAPSDTPKIQRTLPTDARFISVPTSIAITAPFGRISVVNPDSIIIGLIGSSISTSIDLVGVTGMVITRGVQ